MNQAFTTQGLAVHRLWDGHSGGSGEYAECQMQVWGASARQEQKRWAVLQVAQPARLLLGIAERGAYVHFMFAFPDREDGDAHNENISLTYTVPVRDID